MKRIPNQDRPLGPAGPNENLEFPYDDQGRFILVVNNALELLYSSANASRQLRLPKIGEKINSGHIVFETNESLVYDGVRAALENKRVQCYRDLRMAANPEPIIAELKIEAYPSDSDTASRVLLEWFPSDESILKQAHLDKAPVKSMETSSQTLLGMEKSMEKLKSEMNALIRENHKLRIFAMSASHDLRNPLMTWRYSMELMDQYQCKKRKAEACRDGSRAAKRFEALLNLLDELIYDEKIRGGKAKEVKLDSVMKTVLFLLELDIEHCQASIHFDFSQKARIHFPKAFLSIILHNLLSNACKYREPERALKIMISSDQFGDQVLLKVSDNGIGMSQDVISNYLFQPFTRPKQKQQGRGLGLHIVRSVVEQSGGRIEVESEPGNGTTFNIWLNPYQPIKEKKGSLQKK